jgi:beta-lactamase class A
MKKKLIRTFSAIILLTLNISQVSAQQDIREKIKVVTSSFTGDVGVAVMHIEKKDTFSVNGNRHFPMQSVYKFPLALAVLRQVDQGTLSLDQMVHVAREDYFPTWSPLMKKYPEGNTNIPLREILQATVSESDNIGCDLLFNLVGGPKKIDFYIHSLGVKEMSIANTEEEMHQDWNLQFKNWSTPVAMTELLNLFFQKKILQPTTHQFLWDAMVATYLGPNRIKGQIPAEAVVAHRTGTGAPNDKGINGAINDIGIVTLPDGRHFAIVIFVSNTPEDVKKAEALIAGITKVVYDHFSPLYKK